MKNVSFILTGSAENASPSNRVLHLNRHENIYQLGIAVKCDEKGDKNGKGTDGPDAIEDAATQCVKGLNGIINYLQKNPQFLDYNKEMLVFPVIFTTATLYSTDTTLENADLKTGNISLNESNIKKIPWLFLQYPVSPDLKHSLPVNSLCNKDLKISLFLEFIRSIAIVNYEGITEFLNWYQWDFYGGEAKWKRI